MKLRPRNTKTLEPSLLRFCIRSIPRFLAERKVNPRPPRAHVQPYEPTCGNRVVEPGEECDDDSPCCDAARCKLAPGARCSRGEPWRWKGGAGSLVGGDGGGWTGQCCSSECQFLSSATLCEVMVFIRSFPDAQA